MKRTHKEKITSVLALCAGAGLFIWFCIPLFWGVFHVGNGGGILFSLFLIAGGIWYVPLRSRMEQAKHAKPLRVLRRSCWGILAVCFAWAAFLTGCMLWPTPSPSGSGTVVILGCKVGSAALQARIDAAPGGRGERQRGAGRRGMDIRSRGHPQRPGTAWHFFRPHLFGRPEYQHKRKPCQFPQGHRGGGP